MEFIKALPIELIVVVTAALLWLSTKLMYTIGAMLKKSKDDIEQDIASLKKDFVDIQNGLRHHSEVMKISTEAMIEMKMELKRLNEYLFKIHKLEADVNFAHEKIRELQNGQ